MPELDYDAFISYRRSDGGAVARWLRRELEAFRVPKSLRAQYGRKLRVYLDTAYERGTSDFYEHSIKPALLASRYLFVVATPDAARRAGDAEDWIEREVSDFATGPRGRNIVAVRGAGEFDAGLPADLQRRFPNIEIIDLRGASRFWFLSPARAARLSSEKLKLIGPLLDVPDREMPRLRQEEEKRQQTRIGAIAGTALGVLASVTGLSVFALQSRNQAIRALEDSMFAAGSMALQAVSLSTRDPHTARARRLIITRGCDLVDKFRLEAVSEPQISEVVMCRLERAKQRAELAEYEEARNQFDEAIRLAEDRLQRTERIDAGLSLVEARQALAEHLVGRKDGAAAETQYGLLRDEARHLASKHEGRRDFLRSEGEALGQLGDLLAERRDRAGAAASYDDAAKAVEKFLNASPSGRAPDHETVSWLARLHRLAAQQQIQANENEQAFERLRRALAACELGRSDQDSPSVLNELAIAQANMIVVELRRGNADAARTAKADALNSVARIDKSEVASRDLKQRAGRLKQWIEAQDTR